MSYTETDLDKIFNEKEEETKEEDKESLVSPWIVLLSLGFVILAMALGTILMLLPYGMQLYGIYGEVIIGLIPLIIVMKKYKINPVQYLRLTVTGKFLVLGLVFGFALFITGVTLANLLYQFLGPSKALEDVNKNIIEMISVDYIGLTLTAISMLMAGIFEEVAFRGLLLKAFEKRYNFAVGLIVSSLIFGLFHFDPQYIYIFVTFIYGVILGLIYHKYNNLTIPIVAHAFLDLFSLFIVYLSILGI